MTYRQLLLAAAASGALMAPAHAAESLLPLTVEALPLGRAQNEVATPVVELSGDELVFQRRATLGDTLSSQPGINSDTFGGGASRPVIRGQTAPRVKVLSDGSELLDASQVSPDHAITTEPLLLQEIEVLRGPSALLYGGGAIGGAVNLIDSKIPTAIPQGGVSGVAELRAGTNADERAGVAGLTIGGAGFALHGEGVVRRSDDYADGNGVRVPGTYNDSETYSLGGSYVGANGFFGVAYTRQQSTYGLPGHSHEYEDCHPHGTHLHCGSHGDDHDDHDHDHDDHTGEAPPFVDLKSDRFDVRGEYRNPLPGIARVRLRGGYTTYRHDEVDDGEIGSTFKNQGWDGRVEVEHTRFAGWRGVLGVQTTRFDFKAQGTEAFLPTTANRNTGIFLLEDYEAGPVRFELAARQEWQRIARPGSTAPAQSRSPFSASAGAVWTVSPDYSLALSLARSQRAPTAQELYARGVHLATNTFEIGDANLRTETSQAVDLTFRKLAGDTTFTASAFLNHVDRYIFADTLDQFEDFRLIRYAQADARFIGLEAEVKHRFSDALSMAVFGDFVRGKFDGAGSLPRIPAGRLGAHLDYKAGPFTADAEYVRVFAQNRVSPFETRTPGYNMVNMTLAYDVALNGAKGQVYLRGANLLDELALNHASFVKNSAPLPGRTVTLGVRAMF